MDSKSTLVDRFVPCRRKGATVQNIGHSATKTGGNWFMKTINHMLHERRRRYY